MKVTFIFMITWANTLQPKQRIYQRIEETYAENRNGEELTKENKNGEAKAINILVMKLTIYMNFLILQELEEFYHKDIFMGHKTLTIFDIWECMFISVSLHRFKVNYFKYPKVFLLEICF